MSSSSLCCACRYAWSRHEPWGEFRWWPVAGGGCVRRTALGTFDLGPSPPDHRGDLGVVPCALSRPCHDLGSFGRSLQRSPCPCRPDLSGGSWLISASTPRRASVHERCTPRKKKNGVRRGQRRGAGAAPPRPASPTPPWIAVPRPKEFVGAHLVVVSRAYCGAGCCRRSSSRAICPVATVLSSPGRSPSPCTSYVGVAASPPMARSPAQRHARSRRRERRAPRGAPAAKLRRPGGRLSPCCDEPRRTATRSAIHCPGS